MLPPSLAGRLEFAHAAAQSKPALPAGRNNLGLAEERDAVLYVPATLDPSRPVPLMVFFHGGGGSAEKILPFIEEQAELNGFLILAPQSLYPTWDIVIGGNGPDLERLDQALNEVASRYDLDPAHLAFTGFSDGASYALSIGLTNGRFVSHIIAMSGGFMSVFLPEGTPRVFIAHGLADEQLPIESSGRAHASQLQQAGYDLRYIEFNGTHSIQPMIVGLAVNFFLGEAAAPQP
jgi:phospholipase/carboxylesterase